MMNGLRIERRLIVNDIKRVHFGSSDPLALFLHIDLRALR